MNKILISHRGNTMGPDIENENRPNYIKRALEDGYDVEIDVWYINDKLYLGHDSPNYHVESRFLENERLWCHAKNLEALEFMLKNNKIHCFWHENDRVTLTSKGYVWTYPSNLLVSNSIACMPEIKAFDNIKNAIGICSDYIAYCNNPNIYK